MTTYNISFTDPLKPEFQIIPGAFNGPGSATPQSAMRLYGRGALEWGESVDENMLRLSENFASATPAQLRLDPNSITNPPAPLQGQLWFRGYIYARDNTIPVPIVGSNDTAWWNWNFTTLTWDNMSAVVVDSSVNIPTNIDNPLNVNPALEIIGQYIYDIAVDKLYRWDQFYKEYAATWLERSNIETVGPPVNDPTWELLVWNGNQWVAPKAATASDTAPTDPAVGDMWFNTTNGVLYVWDGTAWRPLLYADGSMPWQGPGNLDMAGFDINNVGGVGPLFDALTRSVADPLYVDVAGDTMTGDLILFSLVPPLPLSAAPKGYVDTEISNAISGLSTTYADLSFVKGIYDIGFTFTGDVPDSILMGGYMATRAITLPLNMTLSQAFTAVNPDVSFVCDINKNGVSQGTLTFNTAGVPTFSTAAISLAIGDRLTITSQVFGGSVRISDVIITLKATIV